MQFILRVPYEEVVPLRFGMSEAEIVSVLGLPRKKLQTRRGETDIRYDNCSLRLGLDTGLLVEIGFYPGASVLVDGVNIFATPGLYRTLVTKDGGALKCAGVLFLPFYGITLTGFHDSNPSELTVTAFVRGRLDHLLARFSPFSG